MRGWLGKADQFLIFLLMADAGIVAYGLLNERSMWKWIIAYWIILTTKNLLSLLGGRKGTKHENH